MINTFKKTLAQQAVQIMAQPKDDIWKNLAEQVNQTILDDAFNNLNKAQSIFSSIGPLEPRTRKQQTRIEKKRAEISLRGGEYFKVVSDFIAFRVPCNVNDIDQIISRIIAITDQENGHYWLKGSCKTLTKYTDIVQYIYVYTPSVEYIIEFQVGHPFAAYTFKVDSALRDNPNCGLVDLWKDNMYGTVKQYILDKANNTGQLGNKYEMWDAVFTSHKGNVPDELKYILNQLD